MCAFKGSGNTKYNTNHPGILCDCFEGDDTVGLKTVHHNAANDGKIWQNIAETFQHREQHIDNVPS